MRAPVLVAVAVALAWPAAATANGDPASDVIPFRPIFFPTQGISSGAEKTAQDAVSKAKSQGYEIRIALISSKGDLGLVPGLWRKPQDYAKFLWQEVALVGYSGRLLVVMPNGFGYYDRGGKGVAEADKKIDGIEIGKGPDGLACSGAAAVRTLAGLKPLENQCATSGGGGTTWRDRVLIAAGSAVLIVGLAFLTSRMYRRRVGSEA